MRRMKLSKFLSGYHTNNWYVVTFLPNVMKDDIVVRMQASLLLSSHVSVI